MDGAHYEFSNVKFELLAISESGVEASTHPVYPPPGYKPPKSKHPSAIPNPILLAGGIYGNFIDFIDVVIFE